MRPEGLPSFLRKGGEIVGRAVSILPRFEAEALVVEADALVVEAEEFGFRIGFVSGDGKIFLLLSPQIGDPCLFFGLQTTETGGEKEMLRHSI